MSMSQFQPCSEFVQEGRDTANLGVLLLSFLMRYGVAFAYDRHAVSVGQGGVISRASLTQPIPSGQLVQLVVEDVDTKRWAPPQHMLLHWPNKLMQKGVHESLLGPRVQV